MIRSLTELRIKILLSSIFLFVFFLSLSYAEVSNRSSPSISSDLNKANKLLEQPTPKNLSRALSLFKKIIEKKPDQTEAHMGIVYVRMIEYLSSTQKDTKGIQEALKHVDTVLKLNPKFEDAYKKKSQILFYIGKETVGLDVLKEGIEQLPSSDGLHESMLTYLLKTNRIGEAVEFSRLSGYQGNNKAKLHIDLGFVWLRAGKTEQARESFSFSNNVLPSPEAWDGIGLSYMEEQNWQKAIDSFHSVINLDPKYYNAYYDLAFCYSKAGKTEESIRWLLPYTREFPDNLSALKSLALLYEKTGDTNKARVTWMKIRSKTHNLREEKLATEHIEALSKKDKK